MKSSEWAARAVVALLVAPSVVAALTGNLLGVALLKSAPCLAGQPLCRSSLRPYPPLSPPGNHLLDRVMALPLPDITGSSRLRRAEWHFARGEQMAAASLLAARAPAEPRLDGSAADQPVRSPLLSSFRYQRHLLAGYEHADVGGWEAAVREFRWALILGAPYLNEADIRSYLRALAQQRKGAGGAADRWLTAASALVDGGAPTEAQALLEASAERVGWDSLSGAEQARFWLTKGLAEEAGGRDGEAREAFRQASTLAPEWALPRLYELQALLRAGAQPERQRALTTELSALGPTQRLDPPLPYQQRLLVGYDVDPTAVEAGGPLTVWLWWEGSPLADGVPVGGWWVQPQHGINLAPNPSFTWGLAESGLPLGYASTYVTAGPGRVMLQESGTGADLRLEYPGILSVRTFPIPVVHDAHYLTLARVRLEGGTAVIGRKCFPPDSPPDFLNHLWDKPEEPKQVAAEVTLGPDKDVTWRSVGALSLPLHDQPASYCQLYLQIADGAVRVDDLIFMRVPTP